MKIKIVLSVMLITLAGGVLVADIKPAEVFARAKTADIARQHAPRPLRWLMPTSEDVQQAFGVACGNPTPELISATIAYNKEKEDKATDSHVKNAHAKIRRQLELELAQMKEQ